MGNWRPNLVTRLRLMVLGWIYQVWPMITFVIRRPTRISYFFRQCKLIAEDDTEDDED